MHHRQLEVIATAVQDVKAKSFHWVSFSLLWKPRLNDHSERVYSELYNTDAFIEGNRRIQELPTPEGQPMYESAIIALMLFSDSTHLAASIWLFGNESKYIRAKPSQFAAHHIAYLPSVCFIHEHEAK